MTDPGKTIEDAARDTAVSSAMARLRTARMDGVTVRLVLGDLWDMGRESGGGRRRRFPLHVRFSYPDNGYEAAQAHARKHLTAGEVYTIRTMAVGQSSTYLTLYGVPREEFSSVLFEPYWPPDDEEGEPGD